MTRKKKKMKTLPNLTPFVVTTRVCTSRPSLSLSLSLSICPGPARRLSRRSNRAIENANALSDISGCIEHNFELFIFLPFYRALFLYTHHARFIPLYTTSPLTPRDYLREYSLELCDGIV